MKQTHLFAAQTEPSGSSTGQRTTHRGTHTLEAGHMPSTNLERKGRILEPLEIYWDVLRCTEVCWDVPRLPQERGHTHMAPASSSVSHVFEASHRFHDVSLDQSALLWSPWSSSLSAFSELSLSKWLGHARGNLGRTVELQGPFWLSTTSTQFAQYLSLPVKQPQCRQSNVKSSRCIWDRWRAGTAGQ